MRPAVPGTDHRAASGEAAPRDEEDRKTGSVESSNMRDAFQASKCILHISFDPFRGPGRTGPDAAYTPGFRRVTQVADWRAVELYSALTPSALFRSLLFRLRIPTLSPFGARFRFPLEKELGR